MCAWEQSGTSSKSELVTCEAPPALAAEAAYGVDASAVCSAVVGPADALINVHIALRSLKPASGSKLSQSVTQWCSTTIAISTLPYTLTCNLHACRLQHAGKC